MTLSYAGTGSDSPATRPIVFDWGTNEMNGAPDDERHRLSAAIAELTRQLGRSPNASELAAQLGVDRDDVIESLTWRKPLFRQPVDESQSAGESQLEQSSTLSDDFDILETQLAERVRVKRLPLLLGVLTEQERRIVLLRLAKCLPQSEIASRLGITPATVSRILTRSLEILRSTKE